MITVEQNGIVTRVTALKAERQIAVESASPAPGTEDYLKVRQIINLDSPLRIYPGSDYRPNTPFSRIRAMYRQSINRQRTIISDGLKLLSEVGIEEYRRMSECQ